MAVFDSLSWVVGASVGAGIGIRWHWGPTSAAIGTAWHWGARWTDWDLSTSSRDKYLTKKCVKQSYDGSNLGSISGGSSLKSY